MATGRMRERIEIQRAVTAPNAFNEPVESWSTLMRLYVGARDISAGESSRAQEVGAVIGTRFTIRWYSLLADLSPRDRLIYRGRLYNITAVHETRARRWLAIDAVARAEG